MSTFKNIEEAKDFFKDDRFAMVNGMTITELSEEGCICEMDITDDHRNAIGGIMGGVIFTLGDFACAVASNNRHCPTVAMDVNINFLSSSKGVHLKAEAVLVKEGRTTSVFQINITDEMEKKVALFTGTGYKLQK